MNTQNDISGSRITGCVMQAQNINVIMPRSAVQALQGLPPQARAFTGRQEDLRRLEEALDPEMAQAGVVVISAVAGLGGMGKTELAVQAAHSAIRRGWFPGGVLFLDLFGYDPSRRLSENRALDKLLRALGIPIKQIPADLEDRSQLYRTTLTERANQGQRILVILDNVNTPEQVRPLLPADPRIPSLITSRQTLSGLDAQLIDLGALSVKESVALLRKALHVAAPGDCRVDDEPREAVRVAEYCERLPLALRIVAALLAEMPSRPLSSIAKELGDAGRRLDLLQHGDRHLRAVFDLSYRQLSATHRHALRLLAQNPGPDISTDAAAHLIHGNSRESVDGILRDLARDHMLEHGSEYGRWRLHDLVRLYALEHGEELDDRIAGLTSLLRYLTSTAFQAAARIRSDGTPRPPRFASLSDALGWFYREMPNLVSFAPLVRELPGSDWGIRLLQALEDYCKLRGLYDVWAMVGQEALQDSRLPPDKQIWVRNRLTQALLKSGRPDEALRVIEAAILLCRKQSDKTGEAAAQSLLGWSLTMLGRRAEAVDAHKRAAALHSEDGTQSSKPPAARPRLQ
ncbi:ATP-binding protein [Streptomyces rimosus]|uniref:ATP-binding protein n=1 Tax=Streptomyces rimosus TaxID=1927 RepID=UPI00131DA3C5|nr:NB-ARC domain-containing protein [Streptomyces rimosus]